MSIVLLFAPLNLQGTPSAALGGGTVPAVTFVQRVLRRLNDASGSPIGDLPDYGSEDPVTTTTAAIYTYADEAMALLCRTCYALQGSFSISIPVGGARNVRYGAFSVGSDAPAGSVLWQALMHGVLWQPTDPAATPVRLRYTTETALSLRFRDYLTVPPAAWSQATTYYWYPIGTAGIGVYPPVLTGNGSLTVRGLYIHPAAQTASAIVAMYPYLPDDLLVAIEFYVCWALAAKNSENPVLGPKAALWGIEWERRRSQMYQRLDPLMRAYFPALEPTVPLPQGKK